ncbi:MAG: ATP-dependent Clp protease ATP-binding subunit, partial [Clostridia bacterium]|nr:ATP-dependent Clp protease ATP-binding subunit [Clostridia bacterium]
NTVIIMTSNVGARNISEKKKTMGFAPSDGEFDRAQESIREQVMGELKQAFRPEFLNRIDDIIVFSQLKKEDIKQIALRMTESVRKRLSEMDITLNFSDEALDLLADKGFDTAYGARPLRRAIQSMVEDVLAERMLSESFGKGDTVLVTVVDGKLEFSKQ